MRMIRMTAIAVSLSASIGVRAETVYIDSSVQGWINSAGGQIEPTPTHNMFTGNEFGMRFNSFAAFFIPAGSYGSATISVNPSAYGNAGPSKIDLFDVTTPFENLLNDGHPGTEAFADLASGSAYGSGTLFNTYTTFKLNGNFLNDANGANTNGHYLLIGFTNATLNSVPAGAGDDDGIYIGGVGLQQAPLLLTLQTAAVPEPAAWAMMIAGFGLVGCAKRRRDRPLAEA